MADDKPVNWGLCPVTDVLPAFQDAPVADKAAAETRDQQPTDIEGNTLSGTATVPQYQGNVALKRGDQFLGTDHLSFDTESGNYIAEGNVRYQDSSIRMKAKRAEGNQESDTHKISDIQYQLVDRRGHGAADSIDLQGSVGQMHRSTYTTCDPSQPVWKLSAPQIDVDNDEGFGTARNAVLRIGNVPVLWAPYFKFPIDDRRQTGLLYPQLGMSGRNGFDYAQPIYFNLAPNYDDTLTPRYMSKRGLMLDNEFRYLYDGGRGELQTAYLPNDKLRDKDRGQVEYSGYHNINKTWQARANIAWVSDERYTEDFSSKLLGVTTSSLQSQVGVYGTGKTWRAGLMADYWQLTDYTLTESSLPYSRQPRLFVNWDKPLLPWLEVGVYAEAVHFTHDDVNLKTQLPDGEYVRTVLRWLAPGREALRQPAVRRCVLVRHSDPGLPLHRLRARPRAGRPDPAAGVARCGHQPGHRDPRPAARQHLAAPQRAHRQPGRRHVLRPRDDHRRHLVPAHAGAAPVLPAYALPRPERPADLRYP